MTVLYELGTSPNNVIVYETTNAQNETVYGIKSDNPTIILLIGAPGITYDHSVTRAGVDNIAASLYALLNP